MSGAAALHGALSTSDSAAAAGASCCPAAAPAPKLEEIPSVRLEAPMLFYVQMKWNHEGRITLDQLWEIEAEEAAHAQETLDSGFAVGLWKVAGQKRVIGIIDSPNAEELDRTALGRLPMREYLEFEAVWPLRDYLGFAEDVLKRYRV